MAFWDHARNKDLRPEAYSFGCPDVVYWCCPESADHFWKQSVSDFLKRQTDCMTCARKPVVESYRLSTRFPLLAREWHPMFNNHLSPDTVSALSTRVAWWKCSTNGNHVFCAPIRSRTEDGLACPFCAGGSIDKSQSFAAIRQHLVSHWDLEKNHLLRPDCVAANSPVIVHFICPETSHLEKPHTIRTSIQKATNEDLDCVGCRKENNRYESLAVTNPHVARQWHQQKNGDLEPEDVTAGSAMLVWWKCAVATDHEWRCAVNVRTAKDSGCPFCSGLKTSSTRSFAVDQPYLLDEWHKTKNRGIDPYAIPSSYEFKVFWRCPQNTKHVWEATVRERVFHGSDCPVCASHVVTPDNCLATLYPEVAALWHPTKNGALTPHDVTPGSGRRAFFQCKRFAEHFWEVAVANRPTDCPKCISYRHDKKSSLKGLFPKVARQWHPTRNGPVTPDCVSPYSNKKFWWLCSDNPDHEWQSLVYNRTKLGSGCLICSGNIITKENSLAALHPKIAAQWHKEKNGALKPSQLAPRSGKKIWWKCKEGPDHEWQCSPGDRVGYSTGCPFCAGRGFSVTQTLDHTYPEIAKQWHPVKNGKISPSSVKPATRGRFGGSAPRIRITPGDQRLCSALKPRLLVKSAMTVSSKPATGSATSTCSCQRMASRIE
jgi:hypothetical protein